MTVMEFINFAALSQASCRLVDGLLGTMEIVMQNVLLNTLKLDHQGNIAISHGVLVPLGHYAARMKISTSSIMRRLLYTETVSGQVGQNAISILVRLTFHLWQSRRLETDARFVIRGRIPRTGLLDHTKKNSIAAEIQF